MTIKPFKKRDIGNIDAMTMDINADFRKLERKFEKRKGDKK